MESLTYKPDIYEGQDPYIYISYHQDDRDRIIGILEKLDLRGFRFWIDDGITPGMETDEIIAEHIEKCDFFIAFLSSNYLGFLDTVDELNYSRDVDKEYLLIYLDDVSLPAGLDMRFMRAQNIKAFSSSIDDVCRQLINIDKADRFYGINEPSLRENARKVFDKLEQLYPEHKVFALDAVGKQVSKQISELYVKAGYPSAERLMLDYGFVHISSDEARSLRNSVLYQPGFEPDFIKPRIDYIMGELSNDYPTKVINDVLSKSHKSMYKTLLGVSVWLGYDSLESMLIAYGFTGITSNSGRIGIDADQLISQLVERYKDKEKPSSVSQLVLENPDIKGNVKTINNRSAELFGTTLKKYFSEIGLIAPVEKKEKPTLLAKNRELIIADIKEFYENNKNLGTFEEFEDTLNQLVIKKNSKGIVFISDCSSCSETMKIPYGIDYIEKDAFSGQDDLVTLVLSPSIKEIKDGAFSNCDLLETVIFVDGLERIGNNAFEGCSSLKSIVFPNSLKSIGNEAFLDCEELSEVEFKNYRISIKDDAFDGCIYELGDLQDANSSPADFFELSVDKKNNAKVISYTGNEEIVVIPEMISGHPIISLEKGCFKENASIKEVYMGNSITAINGDVFKDCINLEKVKLSDTITNFTSTAFAGCKKLSEINIPNSMLDIQRGLFKDSPLTTIYIGSGTNKISPDAFYKGDADFATGLYFKTKVLENLVIDSNNEYFISEGTMILSRDGRKILTELGDPVNVVIPEGVEEICTQAFEKLSSISSVEFPSTLKKIGEKAFAGTNLISIEFPKNLEEIGAQAFSFCRSLSSVDFNESLVSIAQQAFEGCPIKDVYIPASVKKLGNDSFFAISTYQGEIDQQFRIDSSNENILADGVALYVKSDKAFTLVKAYKKGLRLKPTEEAEPISYKINDKTTVVASHAFARCNNLCDVLIPEGVLSIGDMAFWDCPKLKKIHIPSTCNEVSPKAFFGTPVERI